LPVPNSTIFLMVGDFTFDFELHWGRFDKVDLFKCEKYYWETHRAVPEILRLFTDYEIRATLWDVVWQGQRRMAAVYAGRASWL